MRHKTWIVLVAGSLLVGTGFMALVVSSPGVARAQQEDDHESKPRLLGLLEEVLGELVADGTLSDEQAEVVLAAVATRIETARLCHRSLRQHLREPRLGHRPGFGLGLRLGALFDDGGVDEEEYNGLAEDHPLRRLDLAEQLEDGLVTPQELRKIFPGPDEPCGEDG